MAEIIYANDKLKKRKKLINLFSYITMAGVVASCIPDVIMGLWLNVALVFCTLPLFLVILFINHKDKIDIAGILFNVFLSSLLFLFANLLGKEINMQIFLLYIFIGVFFTANFDKKILLFSQMLLPFVFYVVLEITNYDLIPKLGGITKEQLETFGIINFSIMFLTMPFLIILIINTYVKSEKEIRIYAQNLQQQNTDLLTSNTALEQFAYVVSHDLRSPIASVRAILDLSKTETNLENLREYQKFQEISLKKLDEFVIDILYYSKNTKTEIIYTKIDFKEFLQEVITQHRYDDNSAAVKISIEIDQKTDFYTDTYRMGIVFNNLIANALRYSDLKKTQPNLLIQGFCNENNAIISFIDNGIGIEKEYLEKIFDIFYRANTHAKGTGIGLYLVREYLQKIKGIVSVRSVFGEGTEFVIDIPNELSNLKN